MRTGNHFAESGARAKGSPERKPDLEALTPPPAQETTHLAFELGDFIGRIPEDLLKPGEHDLHKPLLFGLREIADRLANGISTIRISDLLEMVPEIFADSARFQEEMTLRFPWQRVIALMKESDAAEAETGGETLRQKLSRAPERDQKGAPGTAAEAPTVSKLAGASQIKSRVNPDRESVWFSPMKAGGPAPAVDRAPTAPSAQAKAAKVSAKPNGRAEPAAMAVPASAPDLVALPHEKGELAPSEIKPLPSAPPLSQRASPGAAPSARTAPVMPDLILCPATKAANSSTGESEQQKDETRAADLSGQLESFSQECHHRVSSLRAETARLMQKARAEIDDAFTAAFSRLAEQISAPAGSGQHV